jgi:hypothetical protein
MIFTQTYNTAQDIDPEFIPSLEKLLSNNVPDFDHIINYEKESREDLRFNYILFFGNKTNAPIGFAQVEIERGIEPKRSLLESILQKSKATPEETIEKKVRWKIPGTSKEGIVFAPGYSKYGVEKAYEIYDTYIAREDILSQELCISSAYDEMENLTRETFTHKKHYEHVDCLIKSCGSYVEYLASLDPIVQTEVKSYWKKIHKSEQLKIGEYKNFKEIFEYKENGPSQYKGLKSHPKALKYVKNQSNVTYLTLENSNEVKAIVFYLKGNAHHSFYEILPLDENLPMNVFHQQAILNFFEDSSSDRLHCLNDNSEIEEFRRIGFSIKKELFLSATKPSH